MLELVTGGMGSGKNLMMVNKMVNHLCRGGVIATNIELKEEETKKYAEDKYGIILDERQIILLQEHHFNELERHLPCGKPHSPVLCVVDEAQDYYNSRDWKKNSDKMENMIKMIRMARRTERYFYFITQDATHIDKQIRDLAQYKWKCLNLKRSLTLGIAGSYPWEHFLMKKFDGKGSIMMAREWCFGLPDTCNCYNTKQVFLSSNFAGLGVIDIEVKKVNKKSILDKAWKEFVDAYEEFKIDLQKILKPLKIHFIKFINFIVYFGQDKESSNASNCG